MAAPLRVLVAPNAFKGTVSAAAAAEAIAAGVARAGRPAVTRLLPLADGGDGTAAVLAAALGGSIQTRRVPDAWGRPHAAAFAVLPDGTAVVELAQACGLGRRRPGPVQAKTASSFGAGALVAAALALGCRHVYLALGGSASTDGGVGFLAALGARPQGAGGTAPTPGGAGLARISGLDLSGLPWRGLPPLSALFDVEHPLLGPFGTVAAFAPQKGADPAAQAELEAGLAIWADLLEAVSGRRVRHLSGAGAAGGVGFALAALGVPLLPGGETVARLVGLDAHLARCDLLLTGEGTLDRTTAAGKAPAVAGRHAQVAGVPALALAGQLGPGWRELLWPQGPFHACLALGSGPRSRAEALRATAADLVTAAETAVRLTGVLPAAAGAGPCPGEAVQ